MSLSAATRQSERGVWPTAEELESLHRTSEAIPASRVQVLTFDDLEFLRGGSEDHQPEDTRASSNSELVRAAETGDITLLRSILTAQGGNLSTADLNQALFAACHEPVNLDLVLLLLHCVGINVNSISRSGDTALHVACYAGNEKLARALIEAGADVHSKGSLGRTPLHVASIKDFDVGATLLLQSGADVEAKDTGTWTPIHLSCGFGSPRTQKILISNGADVNYQDEDGWTALHQAACMGNIENAAILLEAGAKIDIGTISAQFTPLHVAISYGKKDSVRFLIQSGADYHRKTSTGFNALQLAVLADSEPIVLEILRWVGNSISEESADKSTAIHIAAGRGSVTLIKHLLASGADTTLRDGDGLKPRDVAEKFGHDIAVHCFDGGALSEEKLSNLCSICEESKILPLLSGTWGLHRVELGSYGSVRGRSDCPFCSLVLRMLPRDAWKYISADGTTPEITIHRRGVTWPNLEVKFDGNCHGYIEKDDSVAILEKLQSLTLKDKYIAVNEVDYSSIRRWISGCEESHDSIPSIAAVSISQRKIHEVLFIDVRNQCVVSGTIESRYIALSYVWGRTAHFQATKATESTLKAPGSLRNLDLPNVIHDAIEFVKNLGEQYLWVDSLCIIQDDSIHKQVQLEQMDIIYSSAWLTLVALTAFDANSGLAGLLKYPRASIWSNTYIDDQRLFSRPPEFHSVFRNSRYGTRAWTLQENILSPRCLYVTNNQIYYSCHGTLCAEDRGRVTRKEADASNSVNWFRNALAEVRAPESPSFLGEKWMDYFGTYSRLVADCTARKLSVPSDVLNATLGPLTALSPYLGPFSLAGLPDLYLDHALLWAPADAGIRTRNENFPSWSWAGWNCPCVYYSKLVYLGETRDPIPLVSAVERFETFWQTAPKAIPRSRYHPRLEADSQAQPLHSTENTAQSWSLNHIQERATAIQVLSFDTEIVRRGGFSITDQSPRINMDLPPKPVIVLLDGEDQHCGVLYDDFDSLPPPIGDAEGKSGWTVSFILLSRTHAPPLSQGFFFDTTVYERRPYCVFNVMLVRHLYNPILRAEDRIFHRNDDDDNDDNDDDPSDPDRPVTQKFERVAIGQIHADAWNATERVLWHIILS